VAALALAIRAGAIARAHWKLIGIALLLLALGLQTHRIALWKAHSAALETRNAQQVAEYREAYNRAVAAATAQKEAKEKEYEHARQVSATAYADLSGRFRAIVMRQASTNPRGTSQPDMPSGPEGAGLPPQSSDDARFSISTSDALICADNTAYAIGAYEWVKSLDAAAN
jgi:hypothetical protein